MPTLADRLRAAAQIIEQYGVSDDRDLHRQVADRLDSLTARHAAAVEVLKRLEWYGTMDHGRPILACPWCGGLMPNIALGRPGGHTPDCKLAELIRPEAP